MNPDLVLVRRFVAGGGAILPVDSSALAVALGAHLEAWNPERRELVMSCEPDATFRQGAGVLQGGALASMLDFAMAFAGFTQLPDDAVLSTLEVAYAQAHADAAGAGPHADFAAEMLKLSGLLARLAPDDAEVQALAATVRFAEARRPARLDTSGAMIPLTEQDPADWDARLVAEANGHLAASARLAHATRTPPGPRALQAAIHGAHAERARTGRTDWPAILGLYDLLLARRDDPVIRVNRAVALAEVEGPAAALASLENITADRWLPLAAARAELLSRLGRCEEARAEYDKAVALTPAPAEALFLTARRDRIPG